MAPAPAAAARAIDRAVIVVGNADLPAQVAAGDQEAVSLAGALIKGGASAYFFDAPEENLALPLRVGSEEIKAYGSGTLGYVAYTKESDGDFLGASGFMLAEVNASEGSGAKVTVRLIPNIGELAIDAEGGTLLRRSQVARFSALARRPRAGNHAQNGSTQATTDPYIPIPSNCVGARCALGLLPDTRSAHPAHGWATSSRPTSPPRSRTRCCSGSNGEPIADPQSGLFCAYNPGTTIVTVTTGGLTSSLPVTVQAGSVRRPCGTEPSEEKPTQQSVPAPPPPAPSPSPTPAGTAPVALSPPVPAPPPPVPSPPAAAPPAPPRPVLPFILSPLPVQTVPVFVPPPLQAPANPTPPSGTSAVTSPVEAPEREEKEEEATESVGNSAVAYRSSEHEPAPEYLLGLLVLAAFAGAAIRRPRRDRRDVRVAPASISAQRTQRRIGSARRRRY